MNVIQVHKHASKVVIMFKIFLSLIIVTIFVTSQTPSSSTISTANQNQILIEVVNTQKLIRELFVAQQIIQQVNEHKTNLKQLQNSLDTVRKEISELQIKQKIIEGGIEDLEREMSLLTVDEPVSIVREDHHAQIIKLEETKEFINVLQLQEKDIKARKEIENANLSIISQRLKAIEQIVFNRK